MHPASLLRLCSDVRKVIYRDYLAKHSMSIALLRQTCRVLRHEICMLNDAMPDGTLVPSFEHQIDPSKLDGCCLTTIDSVLPRTETRNTNVGEWDALFENAVNHGRLSDVDRLLQNFAYPKSNTFPCTFYCSFSTTNVGKRCLNAFTMLLSKQDPETIARQFYGLPCQCARTDFICSAIQQSLFVVLHACSNFFDSVQSDIVVDQIGDAVGKSGNADILHHMQSAINTQKRRRFFTYCILAAAQHNQIEIVKRIAIHDRVLQNVLRVAIRSNSDAVITHILDSGTVPEHVRMAGLGFAAESGNSALYRRLLAPKYDPLSTNERSMLDTLAQLITPLINALRRSDEDFVFYFDIYAINFCSLFFETHVTSHFGCRQEYHQLTTILLTAVRHIPPSRLALALQKFMTLKKINVRQLLLDALKAVLMEHSFRRPMLEPIMKHLSPLVYSNPLSHDEKRELARLALRNDAFEWLIDHFEIKITQEEASQFLGSMVNTWYVFDIVLPIHQEYFARCVNLGATIPLGDHIVFDMLCLMTGGPYTPKDDCNPIYLGRVFLALLMTGSPKLFERLIDCANKDLPWVQIMLSQFRSACASPDIYRSTNGCFERRVGRTSLFATGHLRLYYFGCSLFGIDPVDAQNLPVAMTSDANLETSSNASSEDW